MCDDAGGLSQINSTLLRPRNVRISLLTAAMSFIEPALYEASAFARAKCICPGQQRATCSQKKATHKIDVVLNQIPLERLQGQRSVAHGQHKRVADELLPDRGDIRPLQEVVDKVATRR